jgi:transposase
MADRRLLGMDLGMTSHHVVAVLDGDGIVLARRRCRPTVDSLTSIETTALAGATPGTILEVVVESTGPAWLPVAIFFGRRGHAVYRVPASKAAALRRFLSRYAKTNQVDAETLARLPLVDPVGLRPLELPGKARASMDRRVRACDRLTNLASMHKTRIRDLARQLYPTLNDAVPSELTLTDLVVLERYGNPHALLAAGRAQLAELLLTAYRRRMGVDRADAWLRVARAAVELFDDDPAIPFADLAAELASEIPLLRAVLAERHAHAKAREAAYGRLDPDGLARTCPGSPPSAGRSWSPAWAGRSGSPPPRRSSRLPSSPRAPRRPARPTVRASRSPRPARPGCATSSSARPRSPDGWIRSSLRSTTGR